MTEQAEREIRMIECPGCNGEGGQNVLTGLDHRNGDPQGYWVTCEVCEGCREIKVEVQPIEMEDLDAAIS